MKLCFYPESHICTFKTEVRKIVYGSAGAFILVDKTIICVRGNFVLTVLSRFSSSARMPLKPKFNLEKLEKKFAIEMFWLFFVSNCKSSGNSLLLLCMISVFLLCQVFSLPWKCEMFNYSQAPLLIRVTMSFLCLASSPRILVLSPFIWKLLPLFSMPCMVGLPFCISF